MNCIEERPWLSTQGRSKGRERKEKGYELGERLDQVDLGFERWQVVRFRKARRRQDVP